MNAGLRLIGFLIQILARLLLAVGLALLGLLAVVRASDFARYAMAQIQRFGDAFHLESKMVYLCWRVQEGLALYPDWQDGPYVSNFFGPLYFFVTGNLCRFLDADLETIPVVGRGVSIVGGVVAMVAVGVAVWQRYGRTAGLFSGFLALGASPMVGFGAMTRPDLLADTLGFIGFLLTIGRSNWLRWLGLGLLVAAIFTKQTTATYLLAAVISLIFLGNRRRSLALLVTGGLISLVIIGLVSIVGEPGFLPSLLGEASAPKDFDKWRILLRRVLETGPELIWLPVVGFLFWSLRRPRDPSLATLVVIQLAASIISSLKIGADLNYFLSLRLVAGLAGGALWSLSVDFIFPRNKAVRSQDDSKPRRSPWRRALWGLGLAGAVWITVLTLYLSQQQMAAVRATTLQRVATLGSPRGRQLQSMFEPFFRLARDPDTKILTDDGFIALRQGSEAPFVDPWLFRLMVMTHRIEPTALQEEIESSSFDWILTTHNLMSPTYLDYEFGLPPSLVTAARSHYLSAGFSGRYFLYRPQPTDSRAFGSNSEETISELPDGDSEEED